MTRARLAPRRFPDRIVRVRTMEGTWNSAGEYVPGGTWETVFRASVQPLKLEDVDTVASMFRVKGAWLAGLRFIHSFFTRLSTGRLPSIASGHHALAACL